MPYEVEIKADSRIKGTSKRITSMLVRFPRFVHADLMTHRLFSRNGKSSRAKPIRKYIKEVLSDPAKPVYWGAGRKGMQSGAEIRFPKLADMVWALHKYVSVACAWMLDKLGVHKQFANRLLEPHIYIDLLITGNDEAYANFFALRCGIDGAADPSLQKIARMMARAYRQNNPTELSGCQWHLPFVSQDDLDQISLQYGMQSDMRTHLIACKISAARCARLSYKEYDSDKSSSIDTDLKLFTKLMNEGIPHASPTEHQVRPALDDDLGVSLGGNFGPDWVQFRKTIPNECQQSFDLESITDEDYIIK